MDTYASFSSVPKPSPNILPKEIISSTKELDGKTVTDAKEQPSTGLYGLAIFIGSVALVVLVAFGTVGLLKSYQVITLNHYFEWLSIAIDFVGNTPYYVSLWGITAAGVIVGGGVIIWGSCKIHTPGQENEIKKIAEEPVESFFSADNITKNKFNAERFDNLARGRFTIEQKGTRKGKIFVASEEALCAVVLRDNEGNLQSSLWVPNQEAIKLASRLKDFDPSNMATAFHILFKKEPPPGIDKKEMAHPKDPKNYCIHSLVSPDGKGADLFIIRANDGTYRYSDPLSEAKRDMLHQLLQEAFPKG